MKRRAVQILLALLVIVYRKTWFWWIFNHFSARLVPASREFFQILSILEFSVSLLAILYLLVFEGKKILELKWKWKYLVYLLLASCLWSQLSFRYCVFFFNPSNIQSNGFK